MKYYLSVVFCLACLIAAVLTTGLDGKADRAGAELPESLAFKVMLSIWEPGSKLAKADSGRLDVYIDGGLWRSYDTRSGGLLDFNVPTWATTDWVLIVEGLAHRTFRAEFRNGFLFLLNRDRSDRAVNYYALDGGGYAIEYFQDELYITNQGDPEGPILGELKFSTTRGEFTSSANGQITTLSSIGGGSINALDVAVSEGIAYVAIGTGINLYNVSDPANPTAKGTCASGSSSLTNGVWAAGTSAFMADTNNLRTIDCSNPDTPTQFNPGQAPTGDGRKVHVMDYKAHLADGSDGLKVFDVSNISNPTLLGGYNSINETVHDAFGLGSHSYVGAGDGLHIISVNDGAMAVGQSSPGRPVNQSFTLTSASTYATEFPVKGVHVVGDKAYLATGLGGLKIINVSDPNNPQEIPGGQVGSNGSSEGVFVHENHAYLADGQGGLQVVDVSTPSSPSVVKTEVSAGSANAVTVNGQHLFLADGNGGLRIWPLSSLLSSTTPTEDPPEDDFGGDTTGQTGDVTPGGTNSGFNNGINGARQQGSGYNDNRVMGFGYGSGGSGLISRMTLAQYYNRAVPLVGGMPGVMFQWVYAGTREPDTMWLPIGATGTLPNGVDYQTLFEINASGVPLLVFLRSFPPEFLLGLINGAHTLRYWLVDVEGNTSNIRQETIDIIAAAE